MTKKNIFALHPTAELYGADRIFARCVKFLKDDGFNVDVFVANNLVKRFL
jgi:hypothetical protein